MSIILDSSSNCYLNETNKINQPFNVVETIQKVSGSQTLTSKKQIDHSLYWKIVVQDYAKKLDDSAREKDLHKEQALGYLQINNFLLVLIFISKVVSIKRRISKSKKEH